MMMHCQQWRKKILQWQTGTLPAAEVESLKQHLAVCPRCAQEYAWQQKISQIFSNQAKITAPADFNLGVWKRLAAQGKPVQPRFRWVPVTAGISFAAAFLVLVTFKSVYYKLPPQPEMKPSAVLSQLPQQKKVPLPAHQAVPESKLPVQLSEKPRENIPSIHPRLFLDNQPHLEEPSSDQLESPEKSVQLEGPLQKIRQWTSLKPTKPEAEKEKAFVSAAGLKPKHTAELPTTPVSTFSAQLAEFNARLLKNKIQLSQGEQAQLEFHLIAMDYIKIKIYSREGKLIKTLLEKELMPGDHMVAWDGSTDSGSRAASGIYIMIFNGKNIEKSFKIAVIK